VPLRAAFGANNDFLSSVWAITCSRGSRGAEGALQECLRRC